MVGIKTDSGERLRKEWKIPAKQVHYHHAGTFYMPLTDFPGAYADRSGYVVFESEGSFMTSRHLDHRGSSTNPRVGVPDGLKNVPGYVRMRS
jgi:hypothetical protein